MDNINNEIYEMLENNKVDIVRAKEILSAIKDVNEPVVKEGKWTTTYLYEASQYDSVEMVKLLFENGADPNYYNPSIDDDCALWELQFYWHLEDNNIPDDIAERRYSIMKLFFEYGANPDICIDGETLYDYIFFEVFNGETSIDEFRMDKKFLTLMMIYGGGKGESGHPHVEFTEELDMSDIDSYHMEFVRCEDGYHLKGVILDRNDKVVAEF